MKRHLVVGKLLGALLLCLLMVPNAYAAPGDRKVDICHQTGGGKPKINNVSGNALLSHLNHGDWLVTPAICDDIPDNNCDGDPDGAAADTAYCVDENGPGWTCQIDTCNSPPTDIALDSQDVDENQASGTAVGTFSTTDPDSPGPFTYTLVAGPGATDNASFTIVGGQLQTAATFNFEAQSSYNIRVETDAGDGGTYEEAFKITINDLNDAPTDIDLDSTDVDENQAVGTAVGTLTTTDEDTADTHTYTLVAGVGDTDNASFGVAGAVLETAAIFDFETQSSYSIRVQTDDGSGGTYQEVFTITVNDLNDAPTDIDLDSTDVDENQPVGTAVGTLSSTDVDSASFTYTLVAGVGDTDNASFGIAGAVLETAAIFDFETQSSYNIRVQTDDGAGGLFEEAFTITVNDLNDAPVITSNGGGATAMFSVDENQSAVTTVMATDADVRVQTLTFSITGGADAALFGIVGATGVLTFNSAPDFENPDDASGDNDYAVQVTVTDNGTGSLTDLQDIAVTVADVNEAPAITSNGGGDTASLNVDENTTSVTDVMSTDPEGETENGGGLTYSKTTTAGGGTDNGAFTLNTLTGVLTFTSAPDFEAMADANGDNNYEVQVTVTDSGGLTDYQDITVTVDDVSENDAPVITSNGGGATAMFSVNENQTAVTTVTATDTEVPPQILTFSITGGADAALFGIVGATGVLTFNSAPDYEAFADDDGDNNYEVQVTVTDDGVGTLTDVQDITVTVDDVNDAPTDIALSMDHVDENLASGATVGTFTTTDMDVTDTHTYALVGGTGATDNAAFSIVGAGLQTAAILNFEAATNCTNSVTSCSIRVETSDGIDTYEEVFIIDINNVNDAPVAVGDPYSGAIGNVQFQLIPVIRGGTPVPPTVQVAGTLVSNDTDEDAADTLAVTANAAVATTQGGTAVLDANGRFVYTPAAGYPGTGVNVDQFTYEVCDNATVPLCDNGTVTIEGSGIVWFVDDSSPNNPGTGVAGDAFRNLSSASGAPTAPGDTIFVHEGTQTTGITLQANQSLLGQGVGLVVNTTTLVDAGARPVISNPAGTAITLGAGNTVRGLDITGSRDGIVGNAFNTLTADNVAISTTGGLGVNLINGAGLVTLDSLTSTNSTTQGIRLNFATGTFTFGGGAISGSSSNAVDISNSTAAISYDGTISVAAGSIFPVSINSQSAGSVTFGGLITSTGLGIRLISNAGGTMTFRGGLNLNTTTGTAFDATGGGTVNVCADDNCEIAGGTVVSNMVDTTTGKGVNIQNTLLGTGGVTFHDVAVNGASAGIDIENAGSGGFFTVSGGLIENTTVNGILIEGTDNITISNLSLNDAANDGGAGCSTVSFSCRASVEFNTVSTIDMSNVTILGSDEHGIFGTNVTDLDLTNVSVTNAGQTQEEHGIFIRNLLGTAGDGQDSDWVNVDVTNSGSNGIFVENTATSGDGSEGDPDLLTIRSGSSVNNHATNSALIVETDASAANFKLDVQTGTVFTGNTSRAISTNANTGRLQATVNGSTIGNSASNEGPFKAIGGGSAAAGGGNSELIVNLTSNTIHQSCGGICAGTGPGLIAFSSFSTGGNNGTMRGTIQGNTMTSVTANIAGISLTNEGNSTANRFLIDNNNIQLTYVGTESEAGMILQSRTKQGGMDLVITNNTVNIPGSTSGFSGGIAVGAGNGTLGENNTVCLRMENNSVFTPGSNAAFPTLEFEYQLLAYGPIAIPGSIPQTLEVHGLAGPFTDAALETHIETVNTNGGTTANGLLGTLVVVSAGANLTSGTCVAP